jgi:hypothetical protein
MPQESVDAPNVVPIGLSDAGAAEPFGATSTTEVTHNDICDRDFVTDLNRLRNLKSFLNNEAVVLTMSDGDSRTLGDLFTLRFGFNGRSPTGLEWTRLDRFNQIFFQQLTEAQRRRFLLGSIPQAFARTPFIFAGLAALALFGSFFIPFVFEISGNNAGADSSQSFISFSILPFYLLWLISLGALGSIAFIGMNALSVQQDITFDLLNHRLINLRIALGALFAVVFTIPFGFAGYIKFLRSTVDVMSSLTPSTLSTFDALMLIMPFLFGFSTSLVIMILNRSLEAAQYFFGKTLITTTPMASQPAASSTVLNPGGGRTARRRRASPPDPALGAGTSQPPS